MSPWKDVPASGALPPYRLFTGDLEKPSLDDRQYRMLELQNGLRALLVHDAEADKAAACLAVAVGHFHDPVDANGVAHFCEHMITKGSEPFPEENSFFSYIASNGGLRNAVTGQLTTDYWFTINPSKLEGGISRLAAFFYAPLFTESLAGREINAVDSEFKRNQQNDDRRVYQITKTISVPGNPWSKFSTGNYASLSDFARKGKGDDEAAVMKETRRRLVEWWEAEYCAGRMGLVVIGKESLDELTSMIVPQFSKITNRGLEPRPAFKETVWAPEHLGTVIFVKTVKDKYAFSIQFELPDLLEHYGAKPASFLAHFLGHEGSGSICAYLKKCGWLLSLEAGDSGHSRGVVLFQITGTLTLEGYLHYESVWKIIFDYIAMLRASFPLEPYHYDEVSTMARTRFRFKEKAEPQRFAQTLARDFSEPYPPEWLLSGPYLYREYNEGIMRQLLEGFTPERARFLLLAKSHREEVVGKDVQWQTEKWYGTQYTVRKLDDAFVRRLREPSQRDELFLPRRNPYIPADLSVDRQDVNEPAKYPTLISRSEGAQLWHKKDDQFWVPKAHVHIVIESPMAHATARHEMMTRLFVDLVEDALAETTYDADLAGLSFSVSNHADGVSVTVGGYSDKLDVLLRTVLESMCGLSVDPQRLQVIMEKIKRNYENFYLSQPSDLAANFAHWIMLPRIWTPADKLTELLAISKEDVERHRGDLLYKSNIKVLANGNLTRERSEALLTMAQECLQSRPLLPAEIPTSRSLLLPTGSNHILRRPLANPEEANSSLLYFCQFGESSDVKTRALAALIQLLIREPCFTTLRTKEQLGYIVGTTLWSANNSTLCLGIKIQSTRPPWFVETRVEAFLESFAARLASMTADEFATYKDGLIVKKLERVKNLAQETTRFWSAIRAGHCDFLQHEADAAAIRALTLAEVAETYDTLLRPSSGSHTRKKLSVQLVSQNIRESKAPPDIEGVRLITDEVAFKAGSAVGPAVLPVVSAAFGEYATQVETVRAHL